MPELVYQQDQGDPIVVNLGNPYVAALLGWLVPGAGHLYQRRYAKGVLFLVCVLSTYFVGLGLGQGRVVYASSRPNDFRWQYPFFQAHVGLVTFPAIIQAFKTKDNADPYWILAERFPGDYPDEKLRFNVITDSNRPPMIPKQTLKDGWMAPPAGQVDLNENDVLGQWHFDYKHLFELGTLYTMVAGILNLLAVYDAFCGPSILTPEQLKQLESKKSKNKFGY